MTNHHVRRLLADIYPQPLLCPLKLKADLEAWKLRHPPQREREIKMLNG